MIVLTAATSTLRAEDGAAQPPAAIEFACAAWQELPYEKLFYREGKKFHPLELVPGNYSKLHPLKGAYTLELLIRKEGKEEKDEPFYELVGLAPLVKGTDRMLFLIDASVDFHGLPLQLHGLDDSLDTFPSGAVRFINFTPNPLQVAFGEVTEVLPPGAVRIVKSQVPEEGGLVPFYLKNPEDETVYENRLFGQPAERQTVAIHPPSGEGTRLSLKFLSQRIAPKRSDRPEKP